VQDKLMCYPVIFLTGNQNFGAALLRLELIYLFATIAKHLYNASLLRFLGKLKEDRR